MNLFPMRVLLISANLCEDPYPVYPLGISVIAGALSEEGHSVRQLDLAPCARDGSWKETLSEVYRTFRPGLIGLGIRNVDSVNSRDEKEESLLDFPLEVARFCKENFPEQLILGGAGFSLLPDLLLERHLQQALSPDGARLSGRSGTFVRISGTIYRFDFDRDARKAVLCVDYAVRVFTDRKPVDSESVTVTTEEPIRGNTPAAAAAAMSSCVEQSIVQVRTMLEKTKTEK